MFQSYQDLEAGDTQWFWGFYVALTMFQSYRDLEAGDTQSMKSKWWEQGSKPLLHKKRA